MTSGVLSKEIAGSVPSEIAPRVSSHDLIAAHAKPAAHAEPDQHLLAGSPFGTVNVCLSLIAADSIAVLSSAVLVAGVAGAIGWQDAASLKFLASLIVPLLMANWFSGLYPGIGMHPIVELRKTTIACTLVYLILLGALLVLDHSSPTLDELLTLTWLLWLGLIPLCRAVVRSLCGRFGCWGQPILIFGSGPEGVQVYQSLVANPQIGLKPLGILDEDPVFNGTALQIPYLGHPSLGRNIAKRDGVSWAVIAKCDVSAAEMQTIVDQHANCFPHLWLVPGISGFPSLWSYSADCGGLAGLRIKARLLLPWPRRAKRAMDLMLSVVFGLLLSPLIVALAVVSWFSSPGPIFYRQERIGINGRKFRAWKFRTMVKNADRVLADYLAANPALRAEWEADHKLRNDPRVTSVGRLLRLTSLDELPQLWNVVCGEMSLVGPRPIVTDEIAKYGQYFDLYKQVLPGITGLWQISGRNNTTYRQRVELDSYYVRNWSPWFDLYILACTVRTVLLREGAY